MTTFKKSTLVQLLWSEMATSRRRARRQAIIDNILFQQQRSIIEIHHPPPSDTRLDGAELITPLVRNTQAKQTSERSLEKRDIAIPKASPEDANEVKLRFWNETTQHAESQVLVADPKTLVKPQKSTIDASHPSIAAATIIGIIVFGAICFLLFWYIRRERRRRRLRRLSQIHSPNSDLFNPSSLTLGPETSKTLDDFLMRDIPPERTSLMFSRTRSPSVTYLVDGANRGNRNSYDESSSLTKLETLDTLTRASTDATRPSLMLSEFSSSLPNPSPQSTSAQQTSTTSPRASMSSSVPSSPRSSLLWVTTTAATTASATTEKSSLLAQKPSSVRISQSPCSSNALPSPASSLMQPRSSNISKSSSRLSSGSIVRSAPRGIYDPRGVRQVRTPSSQSASPIAESTSSGQLPSIPSTPSPLFRFSEA